MTLGMLLWPLTTIICVAMVLGAASELLVTRREKDSVEERLIDLQEKLDKIDLEKLEDMRQAFKQMNLAAPPKRR